MPRFQGKVVIITGSSSGIGAGTAVLFAKEGAKVTITGRKEDGLQATKKAMLEAGGTEDAINVVVADVTDALGREQLISSTIQKFGQIDILVNNAGGPFLSDDGCVGTTASTDLLKKTLQLNLFSVVELIQLARPHLVKSKGDIVNVSSIAGQPTAFATIPYYAISKAALDQMTRAIAIELIAEGVRVNSVSPGAVRTHIAQNMGLSDELSVKMYDSFANNRAALPCGKIGEPSNIASVIAFLADRSQSSYIIGQTIIADGGTTLVLASNASDILTDAKK